MRKEGLFESIRSAFSPKKEAPAKTEKQKSPLLDPDFPWYFLPETLGHIEGVTMSEYQCSRRALIVDEPHSDKEGQFKLYKFMGAFFRDNPTLVRRSIFLTEGYPANQQLSLQPLIEAEPNPSEGLIKEVLDSFLITGYMAYEWKHQKGIPIVGIENDTLYDLARDLWLEVRKDPKHVYFQFRYADGSTYDMTTNDVRSFVLRAREKSMANTLIEKCKTHENPMLFVGGGHVRSVDFEYADAAAAQTHKMELRMVQTFLIGKLQFARFNGMEHEMGLWGRLNPDEIKDYENLGIAGYLEKEKIGYLLINTKVAPDKMLESSSTYDRLFRAHQKGDYKEYVDWLISERRVRRGVTTARPSPEAAAWFVNAIKAMGGNVKEPFVGIGDPRGDAKFYKEQHGGTCAVVAQEEIIHKLKGFDPGEETLRQKAIEKGWYEEEVGVYDDDLGKLLELNGIPVEQRWHCTLDDLKREVEQENEVIVGVDAGQLWYNKKYEGRGHAVWVTGLGTDEDGRIVSVAMNDSGNEKIDGGGEVPVDRFIRAWEKAKGVMVATRLPKK